MNIPRRFTSPGQDVYTTVEWAKRTSRISNADGSVVFEMKDAEMPKAWSQLAVDIMVSKYFRKAGVPEAEGTEATRHQGTEGRGGLKTGPEKSARQVIHRLAGCWTHWGRQYGYFATDEDAQAFYDELAWMMLTQVAAPNSPQWFNTGLNWAYGISGPAQGHWIADHATGTVSLAADAYTHPQPHACFIQSVNDDLVNTGGIMDLWVREARLFKYGSGTGTNFSSLRGENENLSGGGKSSGLMSWLRIGDRAAGAIKSGGTTRRAAKMVCLNADHPDIESFVNWKVREEIKVAALVEGMKHLSKDHKELAESLGLKLDYDFNGEAYYTVSGQNSNNSVRLADEFFRQVDADGEWTLTRRTDGKPAKTLKARDLWRQICAAAWRCADPGLQFDSTINAWHTCPASGRINASNPCVTGDTLVSTTTGYRRIRDLVGQSAEIIDRDGRPAFVDRIFPTGRKPVYELATRAGYRVRLTADHRVFTLNRGDVPACDLTLDDVVKLEGVGFGDDFVPEAFGEIVGAALGDGCITRGEDQDFLFLTFGEHEAELAQRMHANLAEAKRWLSTGDGRGTRESSVVATDTGLRAGTSVRVVLERLAAYARLDGGSERKAFTDAVYSLDRRSQAAILRGLFTTDGTVADYGVKSQYVALDSTSQELLRQVQLLLLGFGIKSKIYENRRAMGRTTALLPDGRGGEREYPVQQVHSLRISRASRVRFEESIGFIDGTDKARRLRALNERVGTYDDPMIDRVVSVSPCGIEDVYDLTEPRTHHFVANGLVVHNCSEYMFLDNTACNLASINVLKFYDAENRVFDLEGYEHAIRLWTIVLEISVLMASFPSQEIAELSWKFRTLGLGYANLGAMLMQAGIPYDSEEGRAICGMLSAIMTGRSYAASAEMAGEQGPFPGYAENRDSMLRVIRNHRLAAHGAPRDSSEYEQLLIRPVPINHGLVRDGHINLANAVEMLDRATVAWDEALMLGEKHGYRNAQTTVIAPTGTIGLLMDCDTTGVEPDFALVKFKKLAGGGYFKIANASLRPALHALGYDARQIDGIVTYVMGTLSLETKMPADAQDDGATLRDFLISRGYRAEELVEVENALPTVFEIGMAFNAWTMPERVLRSMGVDVEKARKDPSFNGLKSLGLSARQIEALNLAVCGTQTVEGAPHLKSEHLPVFDCANKCGKTGKRFIATTGHIRMMAAAQPFISGAISKTINLPNEASVDDIAAAYRLSWELGLKANALYRDGCKLSQPLSTKSNIGDGEEDQDEDDVENALGEVSTAVAELGSAISTSLTSSAPPTSPPGTPGTPATGTPIPAPISPPPEPEIKYIEKIVEKVVERPLRRRLTDTRESITHKFNVAGHEGYLIVGLYEDGTPGELFITMAKEGSTIGGLMDSLGTAISVALQYGVPMSSLVKKFEHQRFEPMGMTTNPDIPFAKSLVDYIFRWMGMQFIDGYRDANAPDRRVSKSSTPALPADDHDDDAAVVETKQAATPRLESRFAAGDHDAGGTKPMGASAASHAPRTDRPGGGLRMTMTQRETQRERVVQVEQQPSVMNQANASLMGDAPACDVCGSITVRNGTCYKCLNCGNSMGCS